MTLCCYLASRCFVWKCFLLEIKCLKANCGPAGFIAGILNKHMCKIPKRGTVTHHLKTDVFLCFLRDNNTRKAAVLSGRNRVWKVVIRHVTDPLRQQLIRDQAWTRWSFSCRHILLPAVLPAFCIEQYLFQDPLWNIYAVSVSEMSTDNC